MKILIEILHPAHVHFFRNAIDEWQKNGNEVFIVGRDKDCTNELLNEIGLQSIMTSKKSETLWGLVKEWILRVSRLVTYARKIRPDVMVGIMGVGIAPVGKLLGIPSLVFYDTEIAKFTNQISFRLAAQVCLPSCYLGKRIGNSVLYPSYHELAYLHPDRFEPDVQIKSRLGLYESEAYLILRFVSPKASHDVFQSGFDIAGRRKLIEELSSVAKIFISSEDSLPEDLRKFVFPLKVTQFHHAIASADLVIGESATVCSEAAVLGVPSIFISNSMRGYINEERDRYGLVFQYGTQDLEGIVKKAKSILADSHRHLKFQELRKRLLVEKEDATNWILKFVDQVQKKARA